MKSLLLVLAMCACVRGSNYARPRQTSYGHRIVQYSSYRGKFTGKCGEDGFYYKDSYSFVVCSNNNDYQQPCAPGSRNSDEENYQFGGNYGYRDFCDINLVDYGYGYPDGSYKDNGKKEYTYVEVTEIGKPEDKKGYANIRKEKKSYDYKDDKGYDTGYEVKKSYDYKDAKGYDAGYKTKKSYDDKGYDTGYETKKSYDYKDDKGYDTGYETKKSYDDMGYDTGYEVKKSYDYKDAKGYDAGYKTKKSYDDKGYDIGYETKKSYDDKGYDTGYEVKKSYDYKDDKGYDTGYETKKSYDDMGYDTGYEVKKSYDYEDDKGHDTRYETKKSYDYKDDKGYGMNTYSDDGDKKGYDFSERKYGYEIRTSYTDNDKKGSDSRDSVESDRKSVDSYGYGTEASYNSDDKNAYHGKDEKSFAYAEKAHGYEVGGYDGQGFLAAFDQNSRYDDERKTSYGSDVKKDDIYDDNKGYDVRSNDRAAQKVYEYAQGERKNYVYEGRGAYADEEKKGYERRTKYNFRNQRY